MNRIEGWGACAFLMFSGACTTDINVGVGLEVLDEDGDPEPANFSCLGDRSAPSPGKSGMVSVPLVAFGELDDLGDPLWVPGMEVQVFADNRIPADDACNEDCSLATDLEDGKYALSLPEGGWFAYRVLERELSEESPRVLRTVEVDAVHPGDAKAGWLSTVREPAAEELLASKGAELADDTALVAGRFVDCDSRPVLNGVVRVFDAEGRRLLPGTDPASLAIFYFDDEGSGASSNRDATNRQGRFLLANVPTGEGQLRIEVSGALVDDGPIELVGCERVRSANRLASGPVGSIRIG